MSGSKDPERWVVPGGGIEPTEDAGVAAIREAREEAGVKGDLGRCLGIFEVRFSHGHQMKFGMGVCPISRLHSRH